MTAPTAPAPGYYADPLDPTGERWWDGSAWTEQIRTAAPAAEAVPPLEPDPIPVAEPERDADAMLVPAVEPDRVVPVLEADPLTEQFEAPTEQFAAQQVPMSAVEPAAPESTPTVAPGLYPDPYGQAPLRWWDGQQWTTQTSQPIPAQAAASQASGPASTVPASPNVLPAGAPPAPFRPRVSNRPSLAELSGRLGRKSLAGVLVLVLAIGVRIYFLVDGGSNEPKPATVAAAVNLRTGDLPRGWVVEPDSTASDDGNDTSGAAFERAVERCSGAPDHTTSVTFAAASPTWTRGTAELSSGVSVLRSSALAQQDLRAQQGPKGISCVTKVGTPALKRAFAAKGVALTGLSVTRLPGAPVDSFALRMRMTLAAHGRTVTVWNDAYGFARGDVEVSLTHTSTGGAPDRAVAGQALKLLRSRTSTALSH